MDDLENLYNKRFQDKELSNDDFDVDGLWGAVAEDLDAGDSSKVGYFRGYWPFGILLLLLVGVGAYFYVGTEGSTEIASSTSAASSNKDVALNANENPSSISKEAATLALAANGDSSSNAISNLKNEVMAESDLKEDLGLNETSTSTANRKAIANETSISNLKGTTTEKTKRTEKTDLNTAENTSVNTVAEKVLNRDVNDNIQSIDNGSTDIEETGSLNKTADFDKAESSNTDASIKATKNLETIAAEKIANNKNVSASSTLSTLDLEAVDFLFPSLKELKEKGKVKKVPSVYPLKKKALSWEIEATTGANKLMGNYLLPTDVVIGTSSENGEYGSSYGLKVGILWKKNWTLKTGFEYHQLWSEFNYDFSEKENIPKNNTLAQVVINPLTDSTVNRIYVDTFIATRTTGHEIVHHNQYKLYSIPLEIGWQNQKERFLYGLSVGASMNFVRGQEGRRLDGESIVMDFDSVSDLRAFKDFGIGLRVTPMVGYRLTPRLSVRITPQLEWYGLGKSGAVDGVYRLGGGLGLGWRF